MSSELVRIPGVWGFSYRLKSDPGWRVDRRNDLVPNGDNDGENWVVTSPDGTEYWFGYGVNPDAGNAPTYSTWTIPVFGNSYGNDPCTPQSGLGWCNQAWRWNLDRVIDPDGNVTTYTYWVEHNSYGMLNGWADADYIRGGRLHTIEYGRRAGSSQSGAAKVVLDAQYRCAYLVASCPAPAPVPGAENGFPDVPAELICSTDCLVYWPTFFDSYRYTKVKTYTWANGAYKPVDEVLLAHAWADDGDGNKKLWLTAIQRVGKVADRGEELPDESDSLALPPVNFLGALKDNRVDYNLAQGVSPMRHPRVTVIVDEYGARTDITYGQPNQCSQNPYPNGGWDTNNKDCFPQMWTPPGGQSGFAIFHKYLTTAVTLTDTLGGSPPITTSYIYEGGAAWHHDADDWVGLAEQSWSDWRGYGTVVETNGTGLGVTKYRLFRGMNSDRLAGGGAKSVQVAPLTGGATRPDDYFLAGRVLDSVEYAANWTTVLGSTLYDYESRTTAEMGTDWREWARWTDVAATKVSDALPVSGFVHQQETVTYNADLQPITRHESGWLNETGDERCTRTTYATNAAEGMVSYPASEKLVAGGCDSTTVLSETEWYYDGSNTLGAMGTAGNVTKSRSRVDASTWGPYEQVGYDALGRPTSVTNGLGHRTDTIFTPATGYPATTTVRNPLNHESTTAWQIQRGVPLSETDPNGRVTTYGYDALGQLLRVRQPTEQPYASGKPASFEFSYDIDAEKDDEPVVRTRQVTSNDLTRFEDSWAVYDTLLRERQTQELSPASGKVIVSETSYDARGLVAASRAPQAVTATPGDRITGITWENSHTYVHDALGRLTEDNYLRGGTEAWDTKTAYTHNSIEVTPPEGGRVVSVLDAYGRTVQVAEHDGTDWVPTSYGHDLAGNLRTVTDPAGNVISYAYDMLGRRTAQDDPDPGHSSYTYDAVGNQLSVTDASDVQVHTVYDALGRPTQRHKDSPTGPLLVEWAYDTQVKGLLDSSTRHTAQGPWTASVGGYDARNRPAQTTLTVPAGVSGLAGAYTTSYVYDRADRVVSTTYPAVGDLPAETVTTTYNTAGLPETMVGAEEYVWQMTYDDRGRPDVRRSGPQAAWVGQHWTYDADQRLARLSGGTATATLMDHQFAYDKVGNIKARTTTLNGASWRECFGHDERNRLVEAYTVDASAACDVGTRRMGDSPYEQYFTYSDDGNLLTKEENGTTRTYTYPTGGQGAVRPHAATQVGSDSYAWNANGQLAERTVGSTTESYTWTAEGLLESVVGPAGTTSYVYGPDGERLLTTTPSGAKTLTIGGHEVKASADGTTVHATRTYSFAGQLIATRTAGGVDYLMADQQGSIEISIPSGASTPEAARTYMPYGESRSGNGDNIDTDRGWLGQIEDESTDLSYLNARYYDSNLSQFISTDPLYDTASPLSINPYGYGLGNPTTNTDASGLSSSGKRHGKISKGRGKTAGSRKKTRNIKAKPITKKAGSVRRAGTAKKAMHRKPTRDQLNLMRMHAACPTAECASAYKAIAHIIKLAAKAIAAGNKPSDYNAAFPFPYEDYPGGGTVDNKIPWDLGPNEQAWCEGVGARICTLSIGASVVALRKTEKMVARGDITIDEGNAIRHAFWMGMVAFWAGEADAYELGIAHEQDHPAGPPGDRERDLANNAVGIQHGANAWWLGNVWDGVWRSFERGELVCPHASADVSWQPC